MFQVCWIVLFSAVTPQTQQQNGQLPNPPAFPARLSEKNLSPVPLVSLKTPRHTRTGHGKLHNAASASSPAHSAPAVRRASSVIKQLHPDSVINHAAVKPLHKGPLVTNQRIRNASATHYESAVTARDVKPAHKSFLHNTVLRSAPLDKSAVLPMNTSLTHGSIRKSKPLVDTRTTTFNPKNDVETIRPIMPPQPSGGQPPPDYPPPLPDYPPGLYPYEPPYFLGPNDPPSYHPNEQPPYNPFPPEPPQQPPPYYPPIPPATPPPYDPYTTPELEPTTRYTEPTTRYTEPTTPQSWKSTTTPRTVKSTRKAKPTTRTTPKSTTHHVTKPFTAKFTKRSTYFPTYSPPRYTPYVPPAYTPSPATTPRRLYYPLTTKKPPVPPPIWPHLTSTVRPAAVEIPWHRGSLPYTQQRSNSVAPAVWSPTTPAVEVIGTPSEIDPKYKLAVVSNYHNYNESSGTFSFEYV